jgi:hypothetical protein
VLLDVDFRIQVCNSRDGDRSVPMAERRATLFSGSLFDEGIPRAALGTFPQPLGRLRAAFLANEYGFRCFCHVNPAEV